MPLESVICPANTECEYEATARHDQTSNPQKFQWLELHGLRQEGGNFTTTRVQGTAARKCSAIREKDFRKILQDLVAHACKGAEGTLGRIFQEIWGSSLRCLNFCYLYRDNHRLCLKGEGQGGDGSPAALLSACNISNFRLAGMVKGLLGWRICWCVR